MVGSALAFAALIASREQLLELQEPPGIEHDDQAAEVLQQRGGERAEHAGDGANDNGESPDQADGHLGLREVRESPEASCESHTSSPQWIHTSGSSRFAGSIAALCRTVDPDTTRR